MRCVCLLLVLLCCRCAAREVTAQEKEASPARTPTIVGVVTRDFVDTERKNWEGTGSRPLRTRIWYPAAGSDAETFIDPEQFPEPVSIAHTAQLSRQARKYPLILISHGANGSAQSMLWLGYELAAHGYIAAAVNHLGSNGDEKRLAGVLHLSDFLMWERPKDLSVVLDHLLADPVFGPRIDRRCIGAAGFSLGGSTVISLAGGILDLKALQANSPPPPPPIQAAIAEFEALHKTDPIVQEAIPHSGDSYRDKRIKAVFALAPAIGGGFTKAGLSRVKILVRIVVGQGDVVTPPAENAQRYADGIPGAELTILPGEAGHLTQSTETNRSAVILRQVSGLALAFFERVFQRK